MHKEGAKRVHSDTFEERQVITVGWNTEYLY
jgi:hypothetical protein